MKALDATPSKLLEKLRVVRRSGIYLFSLWVVPLAILLFSIVAITGFAPLYPSTSGASLSFRSLPLAAGHAGPREALAALQTVPQQQRVELHNGAWLLINLPQQAQLQPAAIDFPARDAESITCWRPDTLQVIGSVQGRAASGAMRTSRLGNALMLGHNDDQAGSSFDTLLCRAEYGKPTVFSTEVWTIPDLRIASDRFHRGIALLDGGIVTLALFLTIIALRNREWVFLLLGAWLIGNLRLGAYALGWDSQWLGYALPPDWQELLRKLTLAAYFLVTYTLFTQLFRPTSSRHPGLSRALQWLGVAQLAAAFVLPWPVFSLLSGLIWAFGLVAGLLLLRRKLARQLQQRVFSWRLLSLAVALTVSLAGVVLTLIGQEELLDSFSSVLALLLSNLMVALAVGGIIREGQRQRMRAQTELVTGYAVAPLGLFTLDADGRFLRMNAVLRDMLALHEPKNDTLYWHDLFPPQQWEAVARDTLDGKDTDILLNERDPATRQPRHFALRAALAGEHVEGSLQDITARTRAMNELHGMVDNDPLTQALNRRGIEKKLDEALRQMIETNAPCSLAYMDLDHFKRINGLFGHTAGDEILKQVTERLRRILTEDQAMGRMGSDEFIILFPNMTISEARSTAQRIIGELNEASYQVGQRHFHIRSAIGVVEIHHGMTVAAAISAATRACRDARKQHQDVVVYEHDSSELQAHTEELRLFDQLEGGDSPKGLYLEMQPIMALKNCDDSLNFEILLRVRDTHGRLIPTGKIVSGAEESGTITIIDKWVFSATLEWLLKHGDRLRKTQFVNVNLSGVSLNNDKFIDNLFHLLGRYPQLSRKLCVEITEGVALQNLERTRELITRLKAMGVRIALDDFGAGYTSFSYLKQLGADAIKIDGTLVRDMLASETNTAIVRTIVELAQNLGMFIIAEWVEDVHALEVLREMGVDYVQGYAVSAALTPMEILDAEYVSDLVTNADTLAYISRHSQPRSRPGR